MVEGGLVSTAAICTYGVLICCELESDCVVGIMETLFIVHCQDCWTWSCGECTEFSTLLGYFAGEMYMRRGTVTVLLTLRSVWIWTRSKQYGWISLIYSTPSHNASRPSPLISYALWNLCNTINVTLCDRVTFNDTLKESGKISGWCVLCSWLLAF